MSALKTLVLTSTPSQPNRHLHPQLVDLKASKKANKKVLANGSSDSLASSGLGSSRNSNSLPSDGRRAGSGVVVVGAAGGGGSAISRSPSSLVSSSASSVGASSDHEIVG